MHTTMCTQGICKVLGPPNPLNCCLLFSNLSQYLLLSIQHMCTLQRGEVKPWLNIFW